MLSSLASSLRPSIVRILVTNAENEIFAGTGFFIDEKTILTCAHIFYDTGDLKYVGDDLTSKRPGESLDILMEEHHCTVIKKVEVEYPDGHKESPISMVRNWRYDVTVLTMQSPGAPLRLVENHLPIGSLVCGLGFMKTNDMENTEWPYSISAGHIASIAQLQCGGYEREETYQIHMISMGGMSGAPIISQETGEVVGLIRGCMTWGMNNVHAIPEGKSEPEPQALYFPLSICFATPMPLIKSLNF